MNSLPILAVLSIINSVIFPLVLSNPTLTLILPGCCKTPQECNEWVDSVNLQQTNAKEGFLLRLNPRKSIFTCTSPFSHISIDAKDFSSPSIENNILTVSGMTAETDEEPTLLSFSSDASLRIKTVEFSKNSYCIEKQDHKLTVNICLSENRWYHKCCPEGKGFNFSYGCVDLDKNSPRKFPPAKAHDTYYPVATYPTCTYPKIVSSAVNKLDDYAPTPWKINDLNQITYYDHSSHIPQWKVVTENYCVDELVLHEDAVDLKKCGGTEQDILLICENDHPEISEAPRRIFTYLNIASLGVAMCFLALTAIGFTLLEKQNVHKKSMLFYVLSQFLFYFFIFIIYIDNVWKFVSPSWCGAIGVLAHFFGLSTFTWLLVVNFDLWWTFRVLNPSTEIHWTRLAWYGVIATTIPILVILVALFLQFYETEEMPIRCRSDAEALVGFTRPGYGKELCFLSNNAQLYYFYTPIGILLLTNVVFYSCTSYRLCTLNNKNQQRHRSSCQLLLKLFIVMGTLWVLQLVHILVDQTYERTWYWSIVDIATMLQSIAIFVIFICKKENCKILTRKYPALRGMFCIQGLESIPDNTPDGSTRLSRTDGSQQRKSGGLSEFQQPSEIIQLPYHYPA